MARYCRLLESRLPLRNGYFGKRRKDVWKLAFPHMIGRRFLRALRAGFPQVFQNMDLHSEKAKAATISVFYFAHWFSSKGLRSRQNPLKAVKTGKLRVVGSSGIGLRKNAAEVDNLPKNRTFEGKTALGGQMGIAALGVGLSTVTLRRMRLSEYNHTRPRCLGIQNRRFCDFAFYLRVRVEQWGKHTTLVRRLGGEHSAADCAH